MDDVRKRRKPDAQVELLKGPMSDGQGNVILWFASQGLPFSAYVDFNWRVRTSAGIPLDVDNEARYLVGEFTRNNPLCIHRLLKQSRNDAPTSSMIPDYGTVAGAPALDDHGHLLLPVHVQGRLLTVHLEHNLTLLSVDRNPIDLTEEEHTAAHRAALEYVQTHVSDLDQLGFDTGPLRDAIRRLEEDD